MKLVIRSLLHIFVIITLATCLHAQEYGSRSFSVTVGQAFPSLEEFDNGLSIQMIGNMSFGFFNSGILFSYARPQFTPFTDITTELYGLAVDFELPFAPEASTTPYINGGIGYDRLTVSDDIQSVNSDWEYSFHAGGGIRFSPEQWSNLSILASVTYKRIAFNQAWEHINVNLGIRIAI